MTKLIVSYLSAFFFFFWCLGFAAFLSKRRGAGQRELCSWQQLRFWHHLPPNPLPRKGLTSVCMCVHIYAPHLAIHHFSRLVLTSSQELAFHTSFLPPALDFPDSVWHIVVGGRGRGVVSWNWRRFPQKLNTSLFSYLAWLSEVLDFHIFIFFIFPGSYECGMHGFLLQKQQETEQV